MPNSTPGTPGTPSTPLTDDELDTLRIKHFKFLTPDENAEVCWSCTVVYPCLTARLILEVLVLREHLNPKYRGLS